MKIYRSFWREVIIKIVRRLLILPSETSLIKSSVRDAYLNVHGYMVQSGPFVGMTLSKSFWWGNNDLVSKALGSYERHIQDTIYRLSDKCNGIFVDIGAADGFYAVGSVYSGLFTTALTFEISPKGRKEIEHLADLNGCSSQIINSAEFDLDTMKKYLIPDTVNLCLVDIEGAEQYVCDLDFFEALKYSYIIIEIHENFYEGEYGTDQIIKIAKKYHQSEIIKRNMIDLSKATEFLPIGDDELLLSLSEGRAWNMQWLILKPKYLESIYDG